MIYKFRNLETGQAQAIPSGEFSIGRDETAHVHLEDLSASRVHALLFNVEGRLFIEDNGSANGTLKGKEFITGRVPLKLGDIVYIGSVPFRVDPELLDDGGEPVARPDRAVVTSRASVQMDTRRLPPGTRGAPVEKEQPVVMRSSTAAVSLGAPEESGTGTSSVSYLRLAQEPRPAQALHPMAEIPPLPSFPWGVVALAFLTGLVLGLVFGLWLAKPLWELNSHG